MTPISSLAGGLSFAAVIGRAIHSAAAVRRAIAPAALQGRIVAALAAALAASIAGRAGAQGLGGLGANVASNLMGVAKAVQMFGFVAGLSLVVMGLMELYSSGRSHDSTLKGGLTKIAVGAALLAIDALISSFSSTFFGANESDAGLGGLGL